MGAPPDPDGEELQRQMMKDAAETLERLSQEKHERPFAELTARQQIAVVAEAKNN